MNQPKILALSGSSRKGSWNKQLARLAARAAEQAGASVSIIDLKEFPLPIFDADFEAASGPPAAAVELKRLFVDHGGLLISSPEYNSSITALLKNTIDWISRPAPGEPSLVAFRGKVAALLSASPGALGGLRGLVHLRSILGNIGVIVLPDQVAIAKAPEAFDPNGQLVDPKFQSLVDSLAQSLVAVVSKLQGA